MRFGAWLLVGFTMSLASCDIDRSLPVQPAGASTRAVTAPSASTLRAPAATSSGSSMAASCLGRCTSIERCVGGRCVPNCPQDEVYIPATGPAGFVLGRDQQGSKDHSHRVVLTRPFCIDSTEVTVAAYRECVEKRGCELPRLGDVNSNYRYGHERDKHPVNMVHLGHGMHFCTTLGKRIPTEAEWIWAAGHGDGRLYPWGDEPPTCENDRADFTPGGAPKSDPAGDVGCRGGGTSEVASHPKGKTSWPNGEIFDLGGNVWEWTMDCARPYGSEPAIDPHPTVHPALGDDCWVYSLVGGGWNRSAKALEVGWRAAARRNYQVPGLGFRCVRPGKPASHGSSG